jgi:hypothetical protein
MGLDIESQRYRDGRDTDKERVRKAPTSFSVSDFKNRTLRLVASFLQHFSPILFLLVRKISTDGTSMAFCNFSQVILAP